MDKFKNLLIALAGLAALVGVIIAATPATSQGQGTTSGKDVNVVNTPNVNVVNTPTVQAQQSGAWEVGITGTPTVRDVDEPARQPFQRTSQIIFAAGAFVGIAEFTVPARKRLVIEYVSARIDSGDKLSRFVVRTSTGISQGIHYFVPISPPGVGDVFIVSQQTRLYADPGSTVTIEVERVSVPSFVDPISGAASLSGYLVDP